LGGKESASQGGEEKRGKIVGREEMKGEGKDIGEGRKWRPRRELMGGEKRRERVHLQLVCRKIAGNRDFWGPFVKRFALYAIGPLSWLSCLSATSVYVYCGQTGWMDQDETWHAGGLDPIATSC